MELQLGVHDFVKSAPLVIVDASAMEAHLPAHCFGFRTVVQYLADNPGSIALARWGVAQARALHRDFMDMRSAGNLRLLPRQEYEFHGLQQIIDERMALTRDPTIRTILEIEKRTLAIALEAPQLRVPASSTDVAHALRCIREAAERRGIAPWQSERTYRPAAPSSADYEFATAATAIGAKQTLGIVSPDRSIRFLIRHGQLLPGFGLAAPLPTTWWCRDVSYDGNPAVRRPPKPDVVDAVRSRYGRAYN